MELGLNVTDMRLLDLQLVRDHLTDEQIEKATSLAESKGCMLIRVGSEFSYEAEYFMLSYYTGCHSITSRSVEYVNADDRLRDHWQGFLEQQDRHLERLVFSRTEHIRKQLEQFSFDTGLYLLDCEKEVIMEVLANRVKNQIRFK